MASKRSTRNILFPFRREPQDGACLIHNSQLCCTATELCGCVPIGRSEGFESKSKHYVGGNPLSAPI
jgi:hypothetical protein